jgi:hypothetical protein
LKPGPLKYEYADFNFNGAKFDDDGGGGGGGDDDDDESSAKMTVSSDRTEGRR